MGRGTGDGATPFLCVLGRAERTASHAVQPRFPWCIISHAGLMLPYSPCLTVVFSLYIYAREGFGNRLLVVCNGNGTETSFRSPRFVVGVARGSLVSPAGAANAPLLKIRAFQSLWRASWRRLWFPWANFAARLQKAGKSARIRAEWRWRCGQTSIKMADLYIFLPVAEH